MTGDFSVSSTIKGKGLASSSRPGGGEKGGREGGERDGIGIWSGGGGGGGERVE